MEELLDHIASACFRAWHTSWSKLGFGVNIFLSLVMWSLYALLSWPVVDVGRSALVIIFVFILTFAIYCVWEIRATFPNIRLEKRNTLHGAEILIWNNDVVDLTDLNVDIIQKTWVT